MIEMVIAIVLVGIVIAAMIFFATPVRQAVDATARAELTDTADNALQRIGREVRLALPNSVRVANPAGGGSFIEFIPVKSAGRYRAESSGVACDTGTDELAFDSADTCFKTIGSLPAVDIPTLDTSKDLLVFNNYGEGFDGQNAYAKSGTLNVRRLTGLANEGARQALTFPSGTLGRALHDSPGKRFYIVSGDGTWPSPVTYQCIPPELRRRSGYTMTTSQPSQPSDFIGGSSDLLANSVASCVFDYQPSAVGAGIGLLTLRVTLTKALSSGTAETVTLYHAVHVNNVP